VGCDPPAEPTDRWRAKDRKARAHIGLLLEDSQLHLIRKEQTARGMWTVLKAYHEKSTLSNKVNLLKKLCSLKLTENGDMETHLAQMENLIDQLSALGETLAEQLTVALFLSSLRDSYSTLITALETRPEEDLTIDLVKNKLTKEYKRRTEVVTVSAVSDSTEQKALKSTDAHKKSTASSTHNFTCYFCKKPGHMKKECTE